jgi:hypothetical protein
VKGRFRGSNGAAEKSFAAIIPLDFPGTASIAVHVVGPSWVAARLAPPRAQNQAEDDSGGDERGGRPFSRGHIYTLLSNRIYAGQIAHKGQLYPGQRPALIDAETWSAVRDQLAANTSRHQSKSNAAEPSLLAGLLVDARCPSRAPSRKGGAIAITSLPRRSPGPERISGKAGPVVGRQMKLGLWRH